MDKDEILNRAWNELTTEEKQQVLSAHKTTKSGLRTSFRPLNFNTETYAKRMLAALPDFLKHQPWPLVTSCCASMGWVNALYEDKSKGGTDVCLMCRQPCKVDFMTLEQFNTSFRKDREPVSAEEFTSMWDPTTGPKRGAIQCDEEQSEPEPDEKAGDNCTRCGGPIDHNDPHTYCSNCT